MPTNTTVDVVNTIATNHIKSIMLPMIRTRGGQLLSCPCAFEHFELYASLCHSLRLLSFSLSI